MSRQRKKHPKVVTAEKRRKLIRKALSHREYFAEIMELTQSAMELPSYQGTKYRGRWKW